MLNIPLNPTRFVFCFSGQRSDYSIRYPSAQDAAATNQDERLLADHSLLYLYSAIYPQNPILVMKAPILLIGINLKKEPPK